eukprot:CAMPEP_0181134784 /NCGR_PEP_ID=MMETSP1071-20121207/32274_1 /TAXON_ID=35127 /ORGANISM="Thalassiosira sp., Strain NH16" /LENGTH=313 /DNA_ID=CAMNT_0023221329 /DNA_START=223 /DNA_END=1164 /DNA_ORIENTATION=+
MVAIEPQMPNAGAPATWSNRGGGGGGGGGGGIETLFSTNRGRAILLALLAFVPLISRRNGLLSAFSFVPSPLQESPDELASDAFNSYKLNAPLFEAVKSDNLELVRSLLEGGVDGKATRHDQKITFYNVNAEDPKGLTPLIEATLVGNVDLVELLLMHGARAQPSPGFRHTPLRAACLTGGHKLIRMLLDNGADPNAQSEGGRTPLMGACYLRPGYDESPDRLELSFNAVKAMFADERTDARIKNDFGETALDLCRQRGYNKSMAFLRNKINGPARDPGGVIFAGGKGAGRGKGGRKDTATTKKGGGKVVAKT